MNAHRLNQCYANVNVNVIGAYIIKSEKGRTYHSNQTSPVGCGILIPIAGEAVYTINGEDMNLAPRNIAHTGPSMTLEKQVNENQTWEYILVHYKMSGDEKDIRYINSKQFMVTLNESQYKRSLELAKEIVELHKQVSTSTELHKKMLLLELIEHILDSEFSAGYEDDKVLTSKVKEQIRNDLTGFKSVEDMANIIGMDVKSFAYLFTKVEGVSPKKYLNMVRIRKAEELLLNTNNAINLISELIGFEDPLYFSKLFRKQSGCSPTEFRKMKSGM